MGNILSCKVNYINSLIDWYLKATPCEKGHIFPSFPCQSDANKLPKTEGKNRSSLACCPAGLVFAVKCNLSLGLKTWFFFFFRLYIFAKEDLVPPLIFLSILFSLSSSRMTLIIIIIILYLIVVLLEVTAVFDKILKIWEFGTNNAFTVPGNNPECHKIFPVPIPVVGDFQRHLLEKNCYKSSMFAEKPSRLLKSFKNLYWKSFKVTNSITKVSCVRQNNVS